MATLTPDKIAELESQHGECLVLRGKARSWDADQSPPWVIVLRHATRAQYKMWRAAVGRKDPDAQENLVIGICVYPPRDELQALLDKHPSIPESISEPLGEWMGLSAEREGKP